MDRFRQMYTPVLKVVQPGSNMTSAKRMDFSRQYSASLLSRDKGDAGRNNIKDAMSEGERANAEMPTRIKLDCGFKCESAVIVDLDSCNNSKESVGLKSSEDVKATRNDNLEDVIDIPDDGLSLGDVSFSDRELVEMDPPPSAKREQKDEIITSNYTLTDLDNGMMIDCIQQLMCKF